MLMLRGLEAWKPLKSRYLDIDMEIFWSLIAMLRGCINFTNLTEEHPLFSYISEIWNGHCVIASYNDALITFSFHRY